jgi:hypothetical protein
VHGCFKHSSGAQLWGSQPQGKPDTSPHAGLALANSTLCNHWRVSVSVWGLD